MRFALFVASWAALVPSAADACPAAELAAAGAAWQRRADGAGDDGRAQAAPADAAVAAFERAVAADPSCLEAHAGLLRALFFAGDHASPDPAARRARLDRAKQAIDGAMAATAARLGAGEEPRAAFDAERLAAAVGGAERRAAASVHFWSAIALASWARDHGVLAAVREGVAGRVRDHALVTIALDPGCEVGGAHRLLSTLHGELPRIPLLTPWVDRAQALPEAERAYALAPDHPSNQLFLGLTLLDHLPERRAEAIERLQRVARLVPSGESRIEDAALRRLARERLEREGEPL
jgi:hypothetical protein